ncbi:Wzy polymerase domain-containing protein [Undibacterium sp. RuTC16W]|uniref:PglL family O-oligosaccharyltransferase n=1 Tax=Undibacterium sp. RuTC16W TaxID=3413048 RepID=UPI003BF2A402
MFIRKQPIYSLAIFGIFLSLSYLHPHHIHPYRTYYHDALVIAGLIACIFYFAVDMYSRIVFPKILALPLFIGVIVFFQLILGQVQIPQDLVFPVLYIFMFGLALVVGATFTKQQTGAESICISVAIAHLFAGLLSVAMQTIQISGFNAMPYVMFISRLSQPFMRPYANVAQPNQLALLLCFSLASIWFLYQRGLLKKWPSVILVVSLLWGLALTQSRIGWLIVPGYALILARKIEGQSRLSIWFTVSCLLTYITFILCLPLIASWMGFETGSVADHLGGRSERLILLQQALKIAIDHPWLGVGWFGFCAEQVRIAADFGSTTYAEHSHNLILNLAAEIGILPTMSLCLGLGWWFFQTCIRPGATVHLRFALLFFFAVFVHSMVEFPLWYAFVLLPIGILVGMVHQFRWPSDGSLMYRQLIIVPLMLLGLILVVITLDYHRVTSGFQTLRWKQEGYSVDMSKTERPAFTLFPQFFDYFKFTKLVAREGMSSEEIAFAERMSHRFGYVHVLSKMAEIYVLNGEPEKAKRMMLTLQRLHPIVYPEYFDYWKVQASLDNRYAAVFKTMPPRDAP